MDFSRVRRGELIAGISGVALFIIMFLAWFSGPETLGAPSGTLDFPTIPEHYGDDHVNAFEAFGFIVSIVLVAAVIAGVGLAVLAVAQANVQLPVAASAITTGIGILATLFVLYRLIDPPSELDRSYGLFLGLIAAAGVALGGWMAMQEEGTTFGGEADRLGGGGGPGTGPPPPPPRA